MQLHLCLYREVKSKLCCCTCLQSRRASGTMAPPSLCHCVSVVVCPKWSARKSARLTVTTSEPDTYSDAFLSLIAGALFSWKTQPFHFSQILFYFFYAQHVLQKIAKKKKNHIKQMTNYRKCLSRRQCEFPEQASVYYLPICQRGAKIIFVEPTLA